MVGLPDGSASRAKAEKDGLTVKSPSEAAAWADVIMILAPDTRQPKLYKDAIEPHLTPGKTLMFAHGFNIRFGAIKPPKSVDVTMIAPKAPGHRVREVFVEGGGTPALIAVEQDATGHAKGSGAGLREGTRHHARRRSGDHFYGRDGNRSLRRAGRFVRRGQRTDQGGI